MSPRSTVLHALALTIAIASSSLLAGCVDTASAAWDDARASIGAPPDEIAAKSALDEADAEAARWDAQARLAGVAAFEHATHEASVNGMDAPVDPKVGNGKAPVWYFEYVTSNATLGFAVAADGSIGGREVDEDSEDAESRFGEAISVEQWRVNSDEAVRALQKDSAWQAETEGWTPEFALDALGEDNGTLAWVVMWASESWERGAVGVVDATTGQVVSVSAFEGWGGAWSWDWSWESAGWPFGSGNVTFEESYSGSLSLLEPSESYEFPVTYEGETIEVGVSSFGAAPVNGVRVRVLDAAGAEVAMENMGMSFFGGSAHAGTAGAPGTYTVEFYLEAPDAFARYDASLRVSDGASSPGVYCCERPAAAGPLALPRLG